MSSFQGGISSSYHSIAPYRLYLDLSLDDKEFMSNIQNPLYVPLETQYESLIDKSSCPTILSVLYKDTRMEQFKMFVETYNLQYLLEGDITLFVPSNNSIQLLKNIIEYTVADPADILRYHILSYILTPVELFERKLRLQTKLRNQYFITDGPNIINEFTENNPNKITDSIKTQNGYIYMVDKPLVPYIY
jgi:uncharacterized surface protein with fasciclin (FAS1) repeats